MLGFLLNDGYVVLVCLYTLCFVLGWFYLDFFVLLCVDSLCVCLFGLRVCGDIIVC